MRLQFSKRLPAATWKACVRTSPSSQCQKLSVPGGIAAASSASTMKMCRTDGSRSRILAIVAFGIFGYASLPVSELPSVDFPTIQVQASLPGADPQTMASAVATPLESQFSTIPGVASMTSQSPISVVISASFPRSRSRPNRSQATSRSGSIRGPLRNAATLEVGSGPTAPYPGQLTHVEVIDHACDQYELEALAEARPAEEATA